MYKCPFYINGEFYKEVTLCDWHIRDRCFSVDVPLVNSKSIVSTTVSVPLVGEYGSSRFYASLVSDMIWLDQGKLVWGEKKVVEEEIPVKKSFWDNIEI